MAGELFAPPRIPKNDPDAAAQIIAKWGYDLFQALVLLRDEQNETIEALKKTVAESVLPFGRIQYFATPGTHNFVVPEGITRLFVRVVGGGGGGAYGDATNEHAAGAGGGGGGIAEKLIDPVKPGQVITVEVGPGGAAGLDTVDHKGGSGGTGSTSSFGNYCSATGGIGGNRFGAPGRPGVGVDGDLNTSYGPGFGPTLRPLDPQIPPRANGGNGGGPGGTGYYNGPTNPVGPGGGGAGSSVGDGSVVYPPTAGAAGYVSVQW